MNILSDEQKKKIILLRENGDSYNDINNTLSLQVPKSTLSYTLQRRNYVTVVQGQV